VTPAPDYSRQIRELIEENRALQRRVREYETLLDVLPIGVGIANDRECLEILANRALCRILGTEPGTNVSKSGADADMLPFRLVRDGQEVRPDDLPMQRAARGGQPVLGEEMDIVRDDGVIIRELCFAEPLFDEGGESRGSIGVFLDVTESRRTERALRESEQRYRFLAEAMPQIVWIATLEYEIVYINGNWSGYTGYTLAQTQSGAWGDAIHPEDRGHVMEVANAGRASKSFQCEYRLRRADGAYRWHLGRSRVVRMANGEERWLGTALDIDDRKRAEEALGTALLGESASRRQAEDALHEMERIENQLLVLVEASSTLMAEPDSGLVVTKILDLAQRFAGADAYALWRRARGATAWRIVAHHGLSADYAQVPTEEIGTARVIPGYVVAIEDVESDVRAAHRLDLYRNESIKSLIVVPLTINGSPEGTLSFYYRKAHRFNELENRVARGIADIAAAALGNAELFERQTQLRVQAESAERRANFLAEAGRVLSSSLDIETTLASVAELAVPAISDWASIELLDETGKLRRVVLKHGDPQKVTLAEYYDARYPGRDDSAVRRAIRTGTAILIPHIGSDVLVGRVEDPRQVEILRRLRLKSAIVAPLVAAGQTFGALTFVTAESGRVFGQSDLMLAEELAGRAATAISNARLYREQKAAQEALQRFNTELKRVNEDVNQFAYSASHDLKEPLRMIAIYSQLLDAHCADQLDAEARVYLEYVTKGARRMDMLIRDILAYTQAASIADDALVPVPSELALSKAIENLQASIRETGASVEYEELPYLKIHEIHLMQLFQNLISNAIKYRAKTRPRIGIVAEQMGRFWKISVTDNGIGIAPEYAEQIFRIFTRLHTAEKYSGTGIGLAICQKIVQRYGGQIKVESQEGQGSTFWFTLPG
jgi:PAS domain S-box-containing protein